MHRADTGRIGWGWTDRKLRRVRLLNVGMVPLKEFPVRSLKEGRRHRRKKNGAAQAVPRLPVEAKDQGAPWREHGQQSITTSDSFADLGLVKAEAHSVVRLVRTESCQGRDPCRLKFVSVLQRGSTQREGPCMMLNEQCCFWVVQTNTGTNSSWKISATDNLPHFFGGSGSPPLERVCRGLKEY